MQWTEEASPYDALSEAGITRASTMKQVLEAAADLIEQGLWTSDKRAAWDDLRTVERRLWVDFFCYPATTEEIIDALADFCGEQPGSNQNYVSDDTVP